MIEAENEHLVCCTKECVHDFTRIVSVDVGMRSKKIRVVRRSLLILVNFLCVLKLLFHVLLFLYVPLVFPCLFPALLSPSLCQICFYWFSLSSCFLIFNLFVFFTRLNTNFVHRNCGVKRNLLVVIKTKSWSLCLAYVFNLFSTFLDSLCFLLLLISCNLGCFLFTF